MKNSTLIRIYGLYMHYVCSIKRNPARIIEILVWPAFEATLFALLASSAQNNSSDASHMAATILTGIVFWNCTARIIQENVAQLIDDFTSKNIQSILITPLTLTELLISITAASITKIIFSLLALSIAIIVIFPNFFPLLGLHVLLWVAQLELVGVVLSFYAIAIIFVLGERASFVGWMMSTILQIFSLVFYDRQALPLILRYISYMTPTSYIFEAIHAYESTSAIITTQQSIAALLSIVYGVVGLIVIVIAFRYARKIGTFAKL